MEISAIKLTALLFTCICVLTSCSHKKHTTDTGDRDAISICGRATAAAYGTPESTTTDFIILRENDRTMYSGIKRIIDAYGKYFILDSYNGRTAVSFTHDGNPYASYGKRGNGPGEYLMPWDADVSEDYIQILDRARNRLLRYQHDGTYVDAMEVPFRANAFTRLDGGRILFNLEPTDDHCYQLCITDSTLTPISYALPFSEDYAGGWGTNDIFRKNKDGITYYLSPADTIYHLDMAGNIVGRQLLRFEHGPISQEAKKDFVAAMENGKLTTGTHLLNNPVALPSGIYCYDADVYDTDERIHGIYDANSGQSTVKSSGGKMSVNDIIIASSLSADGTRVISYIDAGMADECADHDTLPDSIRRALDDGNRVLVLHQLK